MTEQSPGVLARLLRDNELGWILASDSQQDRVISMLLESLERTAGEYCRRFKTAISFVPETLESEAADNPQKVRAFLQALATSKSPEMLVMVWRIMQGLEILNVTMAYHARKEFSLAVTLARPGGESQEEYHSRDINDAALLRHLGIVTIDAKPLFDGFYALRLRK